MEHQSETTKLISKNLMQSFGTSPLSFCKAKSREDKDFSEVERRKIEKNKIKFIAIEGNIGAGKSTLFNNIQGYINEYELNKDNHIVFLREPVDLWENVKNAEGKNMLELFYENPQKYAFEFQTMALTVQIKLIDDTLQQNPECKIIVSERSFSAGHNVFTKMLRDDGYISSTQYEIYKLLLKTRTESPFVKHTGVPDKVIYLDIPANICKSRIGKRCREGEGSISLEYLQKCESYYKVWLLKSLYAPCSGKNIFEYEDMLSPTLCNKNTILPSNTTANGVFHTIHSGESIISPSQATAKSFSSTLGSDEKMNNQFSYIKNSKELFIINNNEDIENIVLQIIS
jgi:deoxyadenosine/deoxycytidine kinase